ncbi:hypothetical protein [Lutibacter profundi]|uniref:hypothetical protein n=1 Tax=Lutibacter profundi TaxID=1622118 RepID=UPI00130E430E|nr:hypothetical protein [Lutibacter profundi]
MAGNRESNGCVIPIAIGLFVFLVTLIKADFGEAIGTGIITAIVWFIIMLFFGEK